MVDLLCKLSCKGASLRSLVGLGPLEVVDTEPCMHTEPCIHTEPCMHTEHVAPTPPPRQAEQVGSRGGGSAGPGDRRQPLEISSYVRTSSLDPEVCSGVGAPVASYARV